VATRIDTPAQLVEQLFFGADAALQNAAWQRLLRSARRVSPQEAEDLAHDWALWLHQTPTALAAAQTITSWSGLERALRQMRERRRAASSGLDEHPSPEREQLREALRKALQPPEFGWEGSGRRRRCHLVLPAAPSTPADLKLTFDLTASDSPDRARTLVARAHLVAFARAWLAQQPDAAATLDKLLDAAVAAGGEPFPERRLEHATPQDEGRVAPTEVALRLDGAEATRTLLRSLPRRRLWAVSLCHGHGLGLEAAAARMGVGKSTVGNELKAFEQQLREAASVADGPWSPALIRSLQDLLGSLSPEQLQTLADDGFATTRWKAAIAGRFDQDEG